MKRPTIAVRRLSPGDPDTERIAEISWPDAPGTSKGEPRGCLISVRWTGDRVPTISIFRADPEVRVQCDAINMEPGAPNPDALAFLAIDLVRGGRDPAEVIDEIINGADAAMQIAILDSFGGDRYSLAEPRIDRDAPWDQIRRALAYNALSHAVRGAISAVKGEE